MSRIQLGDQVKDTVTGFKGVAVSKTEFLHGCYRIGVQPKMMKDGKLEEAKVFDEPQLELVKPKKVPKGTKKNGGPAPYAIKQRSVPIRRR